MVFKYQDPDINPLGIYILPPGSVFTEAEVDENGNLFVCCESQNQYAKELLHTIMHRKIEITKNKTNKRSAGDAMLQVINALMESQAKEYPHFDSTPIPKTDHRSLRFLIKVIKGFNRPDAEEGVGSVEMHRLGWIYAQVRLGKIREYRTDADEFGAFIAAIKILFAKDVDQSLINLPLWILTLRLLLEGHFKHTGDKIPLADFPVGDEMPPPCPHSSRKIVKKTKLPFQVENRKDVIKKLENYASKYVLLEKDRMPKARQIAQAATSTPEKKKRPQSDPTKMTEEEKRQAYWESLISTPGSGKSSWPKRRKTT